MGMNFNLKYNNYINSKLIVETPIKTKVHFNKSILDIFDVSRLVPIYTNFINIGNKKIVNSSIEKELLGLDFGEEYEIFNALISIRNNTKYKKDYTLRYIDKDRIVLVSYNNEICEIDNQFNFINLGNQKSNDYIYLLFYLGFNL